MTDDITLLAKTFSYVLKEWLTKQEIAEVIKRNAQPDYAGCCASHDFCDANQAMLDAFKRVFGREYSFDGDTDHTLSCNAWELAVSKQFYTQ